MARYTSGGALDSGFGTGGIVTTAIGTAAGAKEDRAYGIAVQADGKIVVVGSSENISTVNDFALVRYNSDGTLDATFGAGGKVTTAFTNDTDVGYSVAIQNDGKIVVAGVSASGGAFDFAVARYTSSGVLDASFGTGGKVTTAIGSGEDSAQSVAIQNDGKIVVAGYSYNGSNDDIALVRYTSTGALDSGFGSGGKVTTAIGTSSDHGYGLTIQSDGKIVVVGDAFLGASQYDFVVARYTSSGGLDATTAGGGAGNDQAQAVAVQPDGKIVVVGSYQVGASTDLMVLRYNSNLASLDSTFGGSGMKLVNFGASTDSGRAVALQSDGKIVAAGYASTGSNYDFAVARFQGLTTTTTNQSGTLSTGNLFVAPTASTAQIYNNGGFNITTTGYSSCGQNGTGIINHTAGTHSTPLLYLAENSGSAGYYNQSTGSVTVTGVGTAAIGAAGPAVFDQSGGSMNAPTMSLGNDFPGNGLFRQRGGTLTVSGELSVGRSHVGRVEHSSGSVSASPLTIGDFATSYGSYMLMGGSLTASDSRIGDAGSGTFTQTGGTHTMTGTLLLGNTGTGTGIYNAEGGTVSGSVLNVGSVGTGVLNINGGTLTFDLVKTGSGTKTITFTKGTLNATSTDINTGGQGLPVGDGSHAANLNLGSGAHNITSGVSVKATSTLSLASSNLGGLPVVLEGGTLTGNGTVGNFTATSGSVIDLGGTAASTLATTGNVTLATGVNYKVDLINTSSDQINVTGGVALNNATLTVTLRSAPAIGQTFTLVQNDGTDAVGGTFAGLSEGAGITLTNVGAGGGTYTAQISYAGGSGNDVTLRIIAAPLVTSGVVTNVYMTGATLNGSINPNGGVTTAQFEYGTTTSYGGIASVFSLSPNNGTAAQNVSANIGTLTPGTLYHYRLTATNAAGTVSTADSVFYTSVNIAATYNTAIDVPYTAGGFSASGALFSATLNFTPATGTNLMVLNNTGLDFINGTFTNLAQGQTVVLSYNGVTYTFVANYYGGTGNDLVLVWAKTRALLGGRVPSSLSYWPTPINSSGALAGKTILAVAAGGAHGLALCSDGSLAGWGQNTYGNLGDGTTNDRLYPVPVVQTGVLAGKTVVALAAGGFHSMALCSDGTLAVWGWNGYGMLGIGTSDFNAHPLPVAINDTGILAGKKVIAISAGFDHSLALCSDGTVAQWGSRHYPTTNNPTYYLVPTDANVGALSGKTVVAIASGGISNLVLCSDGTMAAWGDNGSGQLGNAGSANTAGPVAVNTSAVLAGRTVTAIAADYGSCLALCSDGTLAAWGDGLVGQLGNGGNTNSSVAVPVDQLGVLAGKTVTSITGGNHHCLALCSDGTLAGWGEGDYGQLCSDPITSIRVPQSANTTSFGVGERITAIKSGSCSGFSIAFVATPPAPVISLQAVNNLTATSVSLNAFVNACGGSAAVSFEYGLTTSYGTTVTGSPSPVTGSNLTNVAFNLSSLNPGTTYHYRAKATNAGGITIGEDTPFTTYTIQEDWREQYFGTSSNSGSGADTFDFDKDGMVNLIEWALGLNPTAASTLPITTTRNGASIEFIYTRSVAAVNAGAAFAVEWSDTLPGPNPWSTVGVTQQILSDNGIVQQVKATLPAGTGGKRFVHLRIDSPS